MTLDETLCNEYIECLYAAYCYTTILMSVSCDSSVMALLLCHELFILIGAQELNSSAVVIHENALFLREFCIKYSNYINMATHPDIHYIIAIHCTERYVSPLVAIGENDLEHEFVMSLE